jgi:hypothetical protein
MKTKQVGILFHRERPDIAIKNHRVHHAGADGYTLGFGI